ncbi:uroporphyrinogen-III synthase [Paracoccus sediminicola]|uniref:uroporphyrinogen-III synthase n=1 Tax=Paracoccus sediminicola TaxID=3017783 RepID=UPI0022F116EA|nr:uroporphyrinogen-III synthase [Paracoccus sediminicola]WBU57212.1 uroporphyrinogen-III synthase [Paracoccus sediminicola]
MTAPLCLLTRPEAQSRAFAAELPGVDCLIAPLLRIVAVPFERSQVDAAPGLVFTSAHAVGAAGPGQGRAALCVGPQTAQAAREAGFTVTEGPGDGDGLIPMLRERPGWLHLRGRHVAVQLPVPGIVVYDQLAMPLSEAGQKALDGKRPLILPLFSPRSAALISGPAASAAASIVSVAISARSDAAYRGKSVRRLIAEYPARQAMVDAVMALISLERSGQPWVEAERGGR